ncbi:nucleotidyl transferase AbiEii/AbiGii toxin family protein [Alteromonas sp. 07-89-2]|jgi:predicted nucleotidyltransferase component of viral defense system|uniref:nucleotidyl transferase AbiEii/AbiGii toxin family protein n=1 Tax=Alteromonas sp. 07-89-2 TaxID=2607609 RepID=UPI00148CCAEA|nr:nucleotidyl transferase AbiEii/AbiGii toxin family protein [Alteromonas sp. 07-89-2]MEC9431081.1 nucleotidyl transferase AbiEii/AbiGii toxin family protein [Pseudomonadota bacterium]NOH57984.1 nucleotidyl transferase AbiEii/AbiGii toxin family protein [Alteromonas sp. 07-89-2]|tara:strand:+ start:323 stop:1225 length:903 start_codon:yes stop_codon:yes gene_type:complete
MKSLYLEQVSLLLNVIPEVAKEICFALHGGTAINLFVLDMPRLSVDIDLTYIPIQDRSESLREINHALTRIMGSIKSLRPTIKVTHKADVCKLMVEEGDVLVKIEVNMVGRGVLDDSAEVMPLCDTAQDEFDVFCDIQVVPLSQLYGGKICAALDRQHPRDLFDVNLLLKHQGYSREIAKGVIYALICSNRPTHEMLNPNHIDQRIAFESQFKGMSEHAFTYEDFEATRSELIHVVNSGLDEKDRAFLLSVNQLKPDWSIYDFSQFPSVKWKLINLEKFKQSRPEDYELHLGALQNQLSQ